MRGKRGCLPWRAVSVAALCHTGLSHRVEPVEHSKVVPRVECTGDPKTGIDSVIVYEVKDGNCFEV